MAVYFNEFDPYAAQWLRHLIAFGLLPAGDVDERDIVPCADGKARRIEPGTFPLAHGISARVGKLRAYGNAIVPQVAAEFVEAYLEACCLT